MAHEREAAVLQAIARLPDDYRKVITWCYQEGRSFEEVAALMERTENAVRKLWFRAIEQLERELGNA